MKICVYCGLEIEESAIVCRYCTRQIPSGAVSLDYPGSRFGLGCTTTSYAIWDLASSTPPLAEFTMSTEGWDDAWYRFRQMEPHVSAPAPGTSSPLYPRFPSGPQEADTEAGRGFTIAAWCCAGLSILILPIILGPVGMILGAVASSKGDPKGKIAIFGALGGMVIGFVLTYIAIRNGAIDVSGV